LRQQNRTAYKTVEGQFSSQICSTYFTVIGTNFSNFTGRKENHSFAKAHATIEDGNHFRSTSSLANECSNYPSSSFPCSCCYIAIVVLLHDHLIHLNHQYYCYQYWVTITFNILRRRHSICTPSVTVSITYHLTHLMPQRDLQDKIRDIDNNLILAHDNYHRRK